MRDGLSKLFLSEMNSLPIQDNNRVKQFYLCDGEVEKCCTKKGCYKNGGPCDYTSDVSHARNFHIERTSSGIIRSIREKKAAPENEMLP